MSLFLALFIFCLIPGSPALAHEEGATSITPDNALGPFLALIVIVLAIAVAKRINPPFAKATEGQGKLLWKIK